MASTLSTLPNDILLDILDLLSQNDLCNLALVSSRSTRPAQRVLFRSICLDLKAPSKPNSFKIQPGNLRIFTQLVSTLSQNPHIRLYVTILSIKVLHNPICERFEDHESLLRLVPRLQSLSLDPPPAHFQLPKLSLPCLQTLNLRFANTREDLPVDQRKDLLEIIARQFWAAGLRSLHIDGISFTPEMNILFPPECHRTASITDLQFRGCGEEKVGCLPDIVLSVKSLERFTLDICTAWEGADWSTSAMAPGTIGQFLRIHASTMMQLEIASSDAAEFPGAALTGGLTGYPNIKKLAVPEPFLVVVEDEESTLVDVLPPNIEELQPQFPMRCMQGEDGDRAVRIKRLEQVAAVKHIRFQGLRRVIWWSQPAQCWDDADSNGLRYGPVSDMEHLRGTFVKVNVKFEWLCTAFFENTPFRHKGSENQYV